jgi:DNA-binding LacI/PurR family transcriptional regulator
MAKAMKKTTVTLQTLADRVGVSRTTASNAFNKPDQLTPDLRDRILAVARELDYCGPDPVAKSLRSGKSGAFGIVLSESLSYIVTDPAAQLMLQGIAEVFDDSEASLLTLPMKLDRSSGIKRVFEAAVDGFILNSLATDDPRIAPIRNRNVPAVVLHSPQLAGMGFVGAEDRSGGRAVSGHICSLGHSRIGVISFPVIEDDWNGPISAERLANATIDPARDRLRGFCDALEDSELGWSNLVTWECSINGIEAGALAAGRLFDRADRPTAILAMSDQLAIGAIQAAKARGLRVPQDVSITGFDDIPAAARSDPPLTTVRQPLRRAGAIGAKMLLDGWEGEAPSVMLPTELIVRASTAPALTS